MNLERFCALQCIVQCFNALGGRGQSCGNGRPCLLPVTDWLFLEQQPSSTKSPPQSKDDDQPAAPVRCHSTYHDEDGVHDVDNINNIVRTTTTSSSPSLDNQDLRLPSPASH